MLRNFSMSISIYVFHWKVFQGTNFTLTLFYVLACAILFLYFFSPLVTSLGEERANLSAFRTFVRFAFVWFCLLPLPLSVWEGLRFVIVALSGLFIYLFCGIFTYSLFLICCKVSKAVNQNLLANFASLLNCTVLKSSLRLGDGSFPNLFQMVNSALGICWSGPSLAYLW